MKYTGGIVAGGSGSIGGCTFSRNRFGSYIRNRSIPVNPNSIYQQTVRNALTTLSSRWSQTLTGAQRSAWETYAANVPTTDWEGNQIFLTGFNWYVGCNTLRIQSTLSIIDAGPTTYVLPTFTLPVPTASASTTSLAFTNTDAWANEVGGALIAFTSRPQSPTINFFKGPYRFSGTVLGSGTPPTSPQVITNPFTAAAPNRLHYKFVIVRADGRSSSPLFNFDAV